METKWWNNGEWPRFGTAGLNYVDYAIQGLSKTSLEGGPKVIFQEKTGLLDCSIEELELYLASLGAKLVYISPRDTLNKTYNSIYSWDSGAIEITNDSTIEMDVRVSFVTNDQELYLKLVEVFTKLIKPQTSSGGQVFTVKSSHDGLELVSLGKASFPLERGNYADNVIKDLDHVIEEFKTHDPCGRLVVVNGHPGTGKTYLMRGLINEVTNALFITVPPSLISKFGNPEFIPTLLDIRRQDKKLEGPIIVLVEDADEILVPRQETGMDNISACLNLSDGLMGHLFDIRILATTNAEKANMDKAILRPGRLCRRINVGELSWEKSCEVFKRLVNKDLKENTSVPQGTKFSLAELYITARDNGWTPPAQDGKMGFKVSNRSRYSAPASYY